MRRRVAFVLSTCAAVNAVPRRQRLLAAWALAVSGLVEVGLRSISLPQLGRLLGVSIVDEPSCREPEPTVPLSGLRPKIDAVDTTLRNWPKKGLCLRRSLVLGAILSNHRPVMRIGVKRGDGAFRAHAWLEIDGRRVPDMNGTTPEFKPLERR